MVFCNSRVDLEHEYIFQEDPEYDSICCNCNRIFLSHWIGNRPHRYECHADHEYSDVEWFRMNSLDTLFFNQHQLDMDIDMRIMLMELGIFEIKLGDPGPC